MYFYVIFVEIATNLYLKLTWISQVTEKIANLEKDKREMGEKMKKEAEKIQAAVGLKEINRNSAEAELFGGPDELVATTEDARHQDTKE